jgi:hypothetical protein
MLLEQKFPDGSIQNETPFLREAGEKQKRWQDAFWKKNT